MRQIVFEESGKTRIDQYLKEFLSVSRQRVQMLIRQEKILVNGRPTDPAHKLNRGEVISVLEEGLPGTSPLTPEEGALEIIHEDADIIVVNKPAGLLTHPTRSQAHGTLVRRILAHTDLSHIGAPLRPGVVHRLDKETSGVIVFAKTDSAYWSLVDQFQNRQVEKTYLAAVAGRFPAEKDCVEFTVTPDRSNPTRMRVRFLKGKKAVTRIQVLDYRNNLSLLAVKPVTGRTHQIRITLKYLGYPILADTKYGTASELIPRTALHAYRLSFRHPQTREQLTFCAPPPQDFSYLFPGYPWDQVGT